MAQHKDAVKRLKQNQKRRLRNRHNRTRMRNQIKALREAVEAGNLEDAQAKLREATQTVHRTAQKGVIHRNQAARRISRLNKAVKALANA